jgi:dipeptidyl aminopeptidase/acylaminoacyl peptidase
MASDPTQIERTLGHAGDAPSAARPLEGASDFNRYFAYRVYLGNLAFTPDGQEIAYIVNTSGQYNIWRQAIAGGWAWQVTTFEREVVRAVLWTPGGELIGLADPDGTERPQMFAVPAAGGVVRILTTEADAQHRLTPDALAPDGRHLAYSGGGLTSAQMDVCVRDLQSGETRTLLADGGSYTAINWSPNGRLVAVVDQRSSAETRCWLVDASSGEAEEVLPHEGERYLMPGPWLPDGSGFYAIADWGREFRGVAFYDLTSRTLSWVLTPSWDVEHLCVSRDGQRMVWVLNEQGRSQLYVRDANQTALRVAGLPQGVIEQIALAPDGQTVALRINGPTTPPDVYVVMLGATAGQETPRLRRLTHGMLGGLAPEELIAPELVTLRDPDDREIPAWLYRPRRADADHPAPAVLALHGGPDDQERSEYRALFQYLLGRGVAFLAPNIRGSTGYGASYRKQIEHDWGGGELQDIAAAAAYLRGLPWVDGHRLAVYGGGFGGFAALSAATRLPELWAAAVDIVGPSNLATFVRSAPPSLRSSIVGPAGDPEAETAFLLARSPITYAGQVRVPLLILQGANDLQVPRAEADQMVERLQQLGCEVDYTVFADEGHDFASWRNQLRAARQIAEFLIRHLLDVTV